MELGFHIIFYLIILILGISKDAHPGIIYNCGK